VRVKCEERETHVVHERVAVASDTPVILKNRGEYDFENLIIHDIFFLLAGKELTVAERRVLPDQW
jgi:hypothetical protein